MSQQAQETVVVAPQQIEAFRTWYFQHAGKRIFASNAEKAVRAVLAAAPASPDPLPPHCQRCGGEIHGWCCQSCPSEFREDDSGNLIFDEGSPDPLLEEAVGLLMEAVVEVEDLRRYANNHGGMIDEERWSEARAFLSKVAARAAHTGEG